MKLRVKVQRHLALAHIDGDGGEFAFVLCRRGLEKLLGQKLRTGEEWLIEVSGETIEKLKENHSG